MTNEYGSDSQPAQEHENDPAIGEENQAHGAEPAVWSDDQPPHDDFGSVSEETATVSQEAATDSEGDETTISETHTSRSMLPIFAGIGGIMLLAVLIYWQFGHSSTPTPPAAFDAAPSEKPSAAVSVPPPASPSSPPSTASGNPAGTDIDALYKPATAVSPSVATPAASTDVPSSTTAMASGGSEASIPPPPLRAAPTPTKTVSSPQPKAQTGQANPVFPLPVDNSAIGVNNAQPATPPATVNWGSADPQQVARINALVTRIDELQKTVDQENRQLNQVSNMVAAQPAMASPNQNNPEIEGRLAKIEQTLLKIQNDQVIKASTAPAIETPRFAESVTSSRTESIKRRQHAHKKLKTVHRKPSSAKPSPKLVVQEPRAASPWVLRAATPKEAWVSGDVTSADLRRVQVGDSLTGVGVVRSIRQTPSGWEIDGTTGTVR